MPTCNPAWLMEQPRQFREHFYETEDAMDAVATPNYFGPAAHMLAIGDLIKVRAGLPDEITYDEFTVAHVNVARGAVSLRRRGSAAGTTGPSPAPAADTPPPSGRSGRRGAAHRRG